MATAASTRSLLSNTLPLFSAIETLLVTPIKTLNLDFSLALQGLILIMLAAECGSGNLQLHLRSRASHLFGQAGGRGHSLMSKTPLHRARSIAKFPQTHHSRSASGQLNAAERGVYNHASLCSLVVCFAARSTWPAGSPVLDKEQRDQALRYADYENERDTALLCDSGLPDTEVSKQSTGLLCSCAANPPHSAGCLLTHAIALFAWHFTPPIQT